MKVKLVTLRNIEEKAARAIVPDIEIVKTDREGLLTEARDADIIIGEPRKQWRQILKEAQRLKWVHVGSAGVEGLMVPEFLTSSITLTCAKGDIAGPNLAEHAFALLLSLSRGVGQSARLNQWIGGDNSLVKGIFDLGGKTLGLVGFGGVGKHLVRIAHGFNMDVVAVRRSPEKAEIDGVTVWSTARFHDLLKVSDVVVVSVPDVPATRSMFNAEAFRLMKKEALLITVGRGKTVDTAALVKALQAGEIGGAGLDVVDPEPLPDDHPLWKMQNVIITSHIAGISPDRWGRNQSLILENLKRFTHGQPLLNTVDKEVGY